MSDAAQQSIRTCHPNPPCRILFREAFTLRNFAYSAVEYLLNVFTAKDAEERKGK